MGDWRSESLGRPFEATAGARSHSGGKLRGFDSGLHIGAEESESRLKVAVCFGRDNCAE